MKITNYCLQNPKIEVLEIYGELMARGAIQLEEFLYTSLDKGKYYKIIDLKHVKKTDGLGLKVLEYFINRGMQICLFNVQSDVQSLLSISGKEDVFKIYNCQDCDEVASLFEKEILGEKGPITDGARGRRHPRINTSLHVEFKYHTGHNHPIMARSKVLNLSEGGIFAEQIVTINTKTGKTVNASGLTDCKLYDLRFKINEDTGFIETRGVCVWETKKHKGLSAGIHFKKISKKNKDMISNYVYDPLR